ncbi:hypothetical protein [Acetobacter orientalis]|uniref:hypothetical protein n=1 Tax=Acetobacter orientalis TaxID=146474 RepID=UPI0039ED0FBA
MSDVLTQKSLQKMKQKLQNNMTNISVSELKTARKKTTLRNAIEAMSDEIESLQKAGLSYSQIADELEKVGLKTKGNTLKTYILRMKNSGAESRNQERSVSKPVVVAAPVVKPVAAPEPAATKVIIKPAAQAPAQKHKAPVAGSKEFDELGF